MTISIIPPHADPYFFDGESLLTIAHESTVRQGLAFFKANQVIEINHDELMLWGRVEDVDEDKDAPRDVVIRRADDAGLSLECNCSAADEAMVCRHMVAVLNAYADRLGETDKLVTATDSAVHDRIKRGLAEVRVEPLTNGWFGPWRAASITSSTHFKQNYRVSIRSLHRRANYCTCPDFANNQLGTCKHIEAVLHKIRKDPDYESRKDQPAPFSYVLLAWDVEDAPRLLLHRGRMIAGDVQAILDDYFDAEGVFTGRLPDEFFRFVELVDDREDLLIGEDASDYVRRLASTASHQIRAAQIRDQIMAGNGRLPGIKARLYPYQVEGVAFLVANGRALLADDMGLGKTLQAICAGVWLHKHENATTILIVCPASLKHQWAREIKKFSEAECHVVQGPAAARGAQYRRGSGFFILNYELIRRDLSVINETLKPDLVILDEAQRIKNWRTKIASAVKLIPSRYAFVLTGTPLENRLEDLYSLLQVVDPKILGPLWRYMIDFHVCDDRGKVLGYRNLARLRQRIAPVMLRRDRRLVRDQLPARIDQRLDIPMTTAQIELHDAAMGAAGTIAKIAKRRPLTPSEQNRLLASLQQARMACNAAGLVDKETEGSPKIDELADILDELCLQAGLKAVVFSQWELMTRMVEKRLRRMGLGVVRLHGGVPTASRGELMDRFREDDSIQVFLSTDAGGVGLNLQSGSVLINLDVPWNPAVLEQRNARIHRLGQTRNVQIITMVASNSYEEQVMALVRGKQLLFDNVISEDATEDVVGVSKKLLETLIDDLAIEKGLPAAAELRTPEITGGIPEEQQEARAVPMTAKADTTIEEAITYCITELQNVLGSRIERILGSGGGLLAVLDRVDDEADRTAARLSEVLPVAVIDQRTLRDLARLGVGSPVAESRVLFDAAQDAATAKVSRLMTIAEEKLKAARILIEQQCAISAVELLLASLLAAASDRAGLANPITPSEAGVWTFSEALPKGIVTPEEAGLIMRGATLAQAPAVPEPLIIALLTDVERFVNP